MRRLAKLAAVALLSVSAPAFAETVAIIGGKVVPGDGSAPIEGATVLIRDNIIVAVGPNVVVPADARIIRADGQYVTPGIFAGFSRLGLVEVDAVAGSNDTRGGRSGFSAGLDVAYGIDPTRNPIAINRSAGITRAVVAPVAGGDIFGGMGAVIDLGADPNAITKRRAFLFVDLGEDGADSAGGSRMASHVTLRAKFREAQDFATGRDGFDDGLLRAEDANVLLAVINGDMPMMVHVEGATDIRQVLALKSEYPKLNLILVGVTEGWMVAPEIAVANVPVIASALNDLPVNFTMRGATQSNVGRMKDAGVTVAIGMFDDRDAHQLRYTPQYAGNLVSLSRVPGATGLTWDEAFASISSVPAGIMGQGGKLGVLKAGARADVVIWEGDPLELSSTPEWVMIDGIEQPMGNRQDRLRDRYLPDDDGQLPRAYRH
jgi:imidazolonepropionase-like amidohydrolase